MWPDRHLTELLKIEHPIILAPMAGVIDVELATEVSAAGLPGMMQTAVGENLPRAAVNTSKFAAAKTIKSRYRVSPVRARARPRAEPFALLGKWRALVHEGHKSSVRGYRRQTDRLLLGWTGVEHHP
jgi:NAD(P)H-dependent flavin oxidoreductase YrpB (nitropropane dioxygenase family)